MTSYSTDMTSQKVLYRIDNLIITIPLTVLLFAVFFLAARFFSQSKKRIWGLRIAVLAWVIISGMILILRSKTVPAADAFSNYDIARCFALGDHSAVSDASYLAYYPHQLGFIAYLEFIWKIWNLLHTDLQAYHFMKIINVVFICAIILLQEGQAAKLAGYFGKNADFFRSVYLTFSGAFLPLLMYGSFVYGEIPSLAASAAGISLLWELTDSDRDHGDEKDILKAAGASVFFMISILLRKNNLILLIAVIIVCVFEWGRDIRRDGKRSGKALPMALIMCAVLGFSAGPVTQRIYENIGGNILGGGVSGRAYLAMGMQESGRAEGWYNGFNFDVHTNAAGDTGLEKALCDEAIKARMDEFAADPSYAARFYFNKYRSGWLDGTYASRQATLATFGGRSAFFDRLYTGDLSNIYIGYCNVFQNLLYGGVFALFVYMLTAKRTNESDTSAQSADDQDTSSHNDKNRLWPHLGLIAVFGGFLFHMGWEMNSRYIFPYAMLLLPYAAYGTAAYSDTVTSLLSRHRKTS